MSGLQRELLKGSLDVMLLVLLEHEAKYGYQLVKEVRQWSSGVLHLQEGSLYPALHRLERNGLITSFWQERDDGVPRRYYQLTTEGRAAATEKLALWEQFVMGVQGVLQHGKLRPTPL
jgi:PadR family transcriptional regulator, regulatory protein PadR